MTWKLLTQKVTHLAKVSAKTARLLSISKRYGFLLIIVGIGPWRCSRKGIFVVGFEQKACNILPLTIQLNFNVAFL
ncbi:hypothetical protein DMR20_13040 [Klebsiella pneumoniae]|nr:hypothetical protein DMR20_13040 [Klebsiella pneumoniae]